MRRAAIAVLLLAVGIALGCGSSKPLDPVSPSSPTSPGGPTTPVVNMAGTWTGTVESSNFPTRAITLVIVQAFSCVDGDWKDAAGEWTGALSGLASTDSFAGQISFERSANAGGKCLASASISGQVVDDQIRWTAGPLTAIGTCNGDLPQNFLLSVKRQP